jgi:hypothetical protein
VQASYMKNVFAALEKQGRLAALAREAPELAREVAAASRMSWLPIALNVRLVEAAAACFGAERGLEILSGCVLAQFETPLWKGFIGSAVRLLGTEPGSLGRFLPQAFSLVFRDCGRWSVEGRTAHELRVVVRELPEPLAAHRLWLRSLAIGMTPLFTLCGTDGRSALEDVDPRARQASYVLRWKPRGD